MRYLPPFLSLSPPPPGEHAKWRCDTPPPPQKGYLSDTGAIQHENKAKVAAKLPSQHHGTGGLSWGGVAFLAVLTVLAVLESTLPSICLSYEIQHNEATTAVLTVLAVSAVVAVSVMTATPLKLNPPFP